MGEHGANDQVRLKLRHPGTHGVATIDHHHIDGVANVQQFKVSMLGQAVIGIGKQDDIHCGLQLDQKRNFYMFKIIL